MSGWGWPVDGAAWLALFAGLGSALLAWMARRSAQRIDPSKRQRARGWWGQGIPTRWYLGLVASSSALLSLGYVWWYLRGGPRIIDATTYLLQAKLYASGQLAFEPPGPMPSFHGRFLYATHDGRLAPLFPPGYPLLLAGFVRLGVPMLGGPLLAAVLSALTYACARLLFGSGDGPGAQAASPAERIARLAALSSALCAVLRYHTADTMSHGLSAALLLGAVYLALLARQGGPGRQQWLPALAAGALLGWAFATRPVTGVVGALAFVLFTGLRPHQWALALSGMGIGVGAFFWQQAQLTGELGELVQPAYYAMADGPPGCFRMGLGSDVGCRHEHGDFIARYMPEGYGLAQALGTTWRRLVMHVGDAGNSGAFFVFVLLGVWTGRRDRRVRLLAVVVLAQVAAYASFYFDGNYPGGGARMFAEVLPFELMIAASCFVRLRLAEFAPALMLLGFAFRGAADHKHLAEREGGRPMYEPAPNQATLVFVDTDHGFNLGFEPRRADGARLIARSRGDAFDTALWELHGRPNAQRHHFDLGARDAPTLEAFVPVTDLRFEAESWWPATALRGGWIEPSWVTGPCSSAGRQLRLRPSAGDGLQLDAALWVPRSGSYRLEVAAGPGLSVTSGAARLETRGAEPCQQVTSQALSLRAGALPVTVRAEMLTHLDYLELHAVDSAAQRVVAPPNVELAKRAETEAR